MTMTAKQPSITLTPKQKKHILGWVTVFVSYSLLGFLAAPSLVTKLAKDYVAETLHLELDVKKLEINPLTLAIKIEGLRITQAPNELLLSADHIYANASLLLSAWQQRAYIEELDVIKPYINANINQAGQLNLLQLLPPDDKDNNSSTAWQLAILGIHQAQIDVADYSRQHPLKTQFNDLSLKLFNISSLANDQGRYQFAAQTSQGESFAWQGTIGLNPIRSQGQLAVKKLQLKPLADYALSSDSPIILNKALLDVQGDYQFQMVNEQPTLNIDKTALKIYQLVAQSTHKQPISYELEQLSLDNIQANWPNPQLKIAQSQIKNFNLQAAQQKILNLANLQVNHIAWQQQADQLLVQQVSLQDLLINGQKNTLLTLPNLLVSNFSAKPQAKQFHTGQIGLTGGQTQIALLKNGEIDLQQELNNLASRLQSNSSASSTTTNTKTQFSLGELNIRNFLIDAQDQQQSPVFKQQITINDLTVYPELDLSKPHQLQADMQLATGGKITLKGQLDESPLTINTQLTVKDLALVPWSSYLKQVALLKLESGAVSVDGHLQFSQHAKTQASFNGNVGVSQFAANDLKLNQRFLAWQDLVAKGLQWQLEPMTVNIKEIVANKPFTRLIIAPDRSINLESVVASNSNTTSNNAKSQQSTTPINIDKVQVNDGSMLFADLSLTPQFATGIQALSGQIDHISTQANKLANIQLKGRVDQYGKALINGQINPFKPDQKTNMAVRFDNVELTTLTPYSAKFAGYRIDKGKLSLDLNYQVANRQLVATNKVVINQLTLGERVDSPDATNLPLRLAVAILKDSNGVIDLNIPITGSLDDPKFKVAPIIWQAVVNVVTKVATAPFRFLAGLVNGQEDIDNIPFTLASSQLNEQAKTNVQKVAEILQKKSDLQIEVRGNFNQQQELAALQEVKFKQLWNSTYPNQAISLGLIEKLYSQQFGTEALAQQKVLNLKPAETGQDLTTQTKTYQQSLNTQLINAQVVSEGELRQLALERAKTIRNQLVEQFKLEPNRIFILEPNTIEVSQNQQVMTQLTLKQD